MICNMVMDEAMGAKYSHTNIPPGRACNGSCCKWLRAWGELKEKVFSD